MKPLCYFIATSWGEKAVALQFRALAEELAGRGHRVVLLMAGKRPESGTEELSGNPVFYTWPSLRPTRMVDARFLCRLILRYRPDCLISNFGANNLMMLAGWLMGVNCRVVWYHTFSAAIDFIDGERKAPRWKTSPLRWRKRFVFRLAKWIVPVSHAALEDAKRTFRIAERKCVVFYNSLADPQDSVRLSGSQLVKQANRLICVGRLYPAKGQDVLIKAIALLREAWPDLQVDLIGVGPCEETYTKLARDLGIADRCVFAGAVSHDEVLKRMAASTATVVPSRSEAFGLVNVESLAVGTPVIACAVGGIVEIIRDGIDGFLVPPDDPEALAEKIAKLLSQASLRQSMGQNARQRFLTLFEQDRVIRAQADWFERIVGLESAEHLYVNEEYS